WTGRAAEWRIEGHKIPDSAQSGLAPPHRPSRSSSPAAREPASPEPAPQDRTWDRNPEAGRTPRRRPATPSSLRLALATPIPPGISGVAADEAILRTDRSESPFPDAPGFPVRLAFSAC